MSPPSDAKGEWQVEADVYEREQKRVDLPLVDPELQGEPVSKTSRDRGSFPQCSKQDCGRPAVAFRYKRWYCHSHLPSTWWERTVYGWKERLGGK